MDLIESKSTKTSVLDIIKKELSGTSSVKYEVEARLGRIYCNETKGRLHLDSLSPVIFRKLLRKYVFVTGVDKWDFKPMQKNFKNLPTENMKDCFKYLTDGNRIRFVEGRYIFCEKKNKIKVLNIYLPEMKYDIRISVMAEIKQMGRMSNAKVDLIRHRDRISYNDGVFNYDFTTVTNENLNNITYEVEVDDPNYSIDKFINGIQGLNVLRDV